MSPNVVGFSFVVLGVFLLAGKWVRRKVTFFRTLFLPSSIIAGFLALLLGPEGLGRLMQMLGQSNMRQGVLTEEIVAVWSTLPSLLINVIFASLFIGKVVPKIKDIWSVSGPQVLMGYMVSFGQYAVGLFVSLAILTPVFDLSPLAGGLIEIGFVGGHGTAAGLADTFDQLGFPEGRDLSLGLATIGIMSGVLLGIVLINWGKSKGHVKFLNGEAPLSSNEKEALSDFDRRERKQRPDQDSLEALSYHLAIVGLAILLAYLIQQGLIMLETWTYGRWFDLEIMRYMPLFPIAMMSGMLLQIFLKKRGKSYFINRSLINRISGVSLDVLIISALATVKLTVIGTYFAPFLILSGVAILWNLIAFIFLARVLIPYFWFERGIGDLGQAMGMTATGLLLMKIADPDNQSMAFESFGYKQLLFEPFVGGGLFTALSLPLIHTFGPVTMLIVTAMLTFGFFAIGVRVAYRRM